MAVLVLLTGCDPDTAEIDACTPRIERMREQLSVAYAGDDVPADVAPWVLELHGRFAASKDMYARAAMLQDGVGRAVEGCYGLADAFRVAAGAPVGARRAAMAREVPTALASCRCRGVDVESLSFLLRLSPAP